MKYSSLKDYFKSGKTKQADLADKLKISEAFMCLLKQGKRTPSLKLASKISKETGVPILALLPDR